MVADQGLGEHSGIVHPGVRKPVVYSSLRVQVQTLMTYVVFSKCHLSF